MAGPARVTNSLEERNVHKTSRTKFMMTKKAMSKMMIWSLKSLMSMSKMTRSKEGAIQGFLPYPSYGRHLERYVAGLAVPGQCR